MTPALNWATHSDDALFLEQEVELEEQHEFNYSLLQEKDAILETPTSSSTVMETSMRKVDNAAEESDLGDFLLEAFDDDLEQHLCELESLCT